ncbi:MAG: sugar phosphate isomerase/epimerase [Bacilli bacterium]|nr:sugar phosphate isomerase/epimerase [Bacilli bacterium]
MARKIVINTGAVYRLGDDKKVLRLIKDAGFDAFDLSLYWKGTVEHIGEGDDFLKKAGELKEYADSLGLECRMTHSDFFHGNDANTNKIRDERMRKDMKISALFGAKYIVVHPVLDYSYEENISFVKKLCPLAKQLGISIAIENVWTVNENDKIAPMCTSTPTGIVKFLNDVGDDNVVACLDIGHAEMNQIGTTAVDMIRALGPKVACLHIHDNDKWCDSHQMPYTQKINFKNVLDALKEVNYKGDITFEVETCYWRGEDPSASLPFELYPAFLRLELEIGRYFQKYLDSEENI